MFLVLLLLAVSTVVYSNRENIARNKKVYQSTTLHYGNQPYDWSAEFAIDGKSNFSDDMCRCCSGAGYEMPKKGPWWELDLGEVVQLGKIVVYGRYDKAGVHQLQYFQLFLSVTTPYVNASDEPFYKNNVSMESYVAKRGITTISLGDRAVKYVAFHLKDPPSWGNEVLMVICEVEIFKACKDGTFEPNCSPCHCDGKHCDKATGRCPSGVCLAGWKGDKCNQECKQGDYGANCQYRCGRCRGAKPCDRISGKCTDGCEDGYQNTICDKECDNGWFGQDCKHECGKCHGTVCNKSNGSCLQGCQNGYHGQICDQECTKGLFGRNCADMCGYCKDNDCDRFNGECNNGCTAGYRGTQCSDVCLEKSYGQGCTETCGHCFSGSCDNVNGSCDNKGCLAGYEGDRCDKGCQYGKYGPNCRQQCVNCREGCNPVDGECFGGCKQGFKGRYCNENCDAGTYGDKCASLCGNCADSRACDPIIGECHSGCLPGFQTTLCTSICPFGKYGQGCQSVCGYCLNNATCHHIYGNCSGGCASGYTNGNMCDKSCLSGSYGINCAYQCGNCLHATECNIYTGLCESGCKPGYRGHYCNQTCQDGFFGQNCSQKCGQCLNNSACDAISGECKNGCVPGIEGLICNTTCNVGKYGSNCAEKCGNCLKPDQCRRTDGSCEKGCKEGFKGVTCKHGCENGTYGRNCNSTCGNCANGETCDASSGNCPGQCTAGFKDKLCQQECNIGTYGINCLKQCGHCLDEHGCDIRSGSCKNGCDAGFRGITCDEACPGGLYGINCQRTCGRCYEGNDFCNAFNGTCINGCEIGLKPSLCQEECSPGTYGEQCNNTCGQCAVDTSCNAKTGMCHLCQPGFLPHLCQHKCHAGTYGHNCNSSCGNCLRNSTCHHVTGVCEKGCSINFFGDWCTSAQIEDQRDQQMSAGATAGCVITTLGVLGFLAFVGFVIRRKRQKNGDGHLVIVDNHERVGENEDASHQYNDQNNEMPMSVLNQEHTQDLALHAVPVEEAVYAVPEKTKVLPVTKLWDFIEQQRECKFEQLISEYKSLRSGLLHKHEVGSQDENKAKHKYKEMFAYDHNRVILKVTRLGEGDYINASFIDGTERGSKFIASQGPIASMVADFWRMVWQQKTSIIVMLTNPVEGGKLKCMQYWPKEGKVATYGPFVLSVKSLVNFKDYDHRKLEVKYDSNKCRVVNHYHFRSWPDKDVPENVWCLVNFWRAVDEAASAAKNKAPIIVHCSAGIGRTGTFIAIDNTYYQARAKGGVHPLSIVQKLREQRINMVQTKNQYLYLHEAAAEALFFGTDSILIEQFEEMYHYMSHSQRFQSQFKLIQDSLEHQQAEPDLIYVNAPNSRPGSNQVQQNLEAVTFRNFLKQNVYILCNLPSQASTEDLWELILSFKPMTVVTVTNKLWTNQKIKQCTAGTYNLMQSEAVNQESYHEFTIEVKRTSQTTKQLKLFEYRCWKDGSTTPGNVQTLLQTILAIRAWQCIPSAENPVVIMCSDGVTQSGLLCAMLNEIDRIERTGGKTNFVHTVKTMKAKRQDVIPNVEQYLYCMDALLAYATKTDDAMTTEYVYQNL